MAALPDKDTERAGEIVERLQETLRKEETFSLFPTWLVQVIEEKLWQKFSHTATKQVFTWNDFDKFVTARRPLGLEVKGGVKHLLEDCRFLEKQGDADAEKARSLLEGMLPVQPTHEESPGGRGKKSGSNTTGFLRASRSGHLARLKRDRPDLAERVIAGKLSANQAAQQAGFRQRMIQHPPTVEGFTRAMLRHLDAHQRAELMGRLIMITREDRCDLEDAHAALKEG